MPRADEL
jgi:hypothetical protein